MPMFDVEITLDGDELRRYAVEAKSEADAREIALAALPEPDVMVTALPPAVDGSGFEFDMIYKGGEWQ